MNTEKTSPSAPNNAVTSPQRAERNDCTQLSPERSSATHAATSGGSRRKRIWSSSLGSPPPLLNLDNVLRDRITRDNNTLPVTSQLNTLPSTTISSQPQTLSSYAAIPTAVPSAEANALDLRTNQRQAAVTSHITQQILTSRIPLTPRPGSSMHPMPTSYPTFDLVKRARSNESALPAVQYGPEFNGNDVERFSSSFETRENSLSPPEEGSPAPAVPSQSIKQEVVVLDDEDVVTSPPLSREDANEEMRRYPTKKSRIIQRFASTETSGSERKGWLEDQHFSEEMPPLRAHSDDNIGLQRASTRTQHNHASSGNIERAQPCSMSVQNNDVTHISAANSPQYSASHTAANDVSNVPEVVASLWTRVREKLRKMTGRVALEDFRLLMFVAGAI